MKYLVIVTALLATIAAAASLDDNGNLILSKEEVARTQAVFNQLQTQIHYQQMRIEELEKAIIQIERQKCV